MSEIRPFHLAIPVTDLLAAENFYCGVLGCSKGRTAPRWVDLDFFGHQVSLHLVADGDDAPASNPVDGDLVPSRHFGVILDMDDWRELANRLEKAACKFLLSPRIRFEARSANRLPCSSATHHRTPWSSKASQIRRNFL